MINRLSILIAAKLLVIRILHEAQSWSFFRCLEEVARSQYCGSLLRCWVLFVVEFPACVNPLQITSHSFRDFWVLAGWSVSYAFWLISLLNEIVFSFIVNSPWWDYAEFGCNYFKWSALVWVVWSYPGACDLILLPKRWFWSDELIVAIDVLCCSLIGSHALEFVFLRRDGKSLSLASLFCRLIESSCV